MSSSEILSWYLKINKAFYTLKLKKLHFLIEFT